MKFFTPQLYVDFNSNDPTIADRADAQWEQAITDYRKRILSLRHQLPHAAFAMAHDLCLHDAEYLGYTITPVPKSSGETATVAVRQDENVVLLFYVLAEEPTLSSPHSADAYSQQHARWLYDEVDCVSDGVFSHDILLSNGRVLAVRFVAFDMLTVHQRDFNKFTDLSMTVPAGN